MTRRILLAAAIAPLLAAADVRAGGDAVDEQAKGIFFRDPDKDTADRIAQCIAHFATVSVQDRAKARRELEQIGWWAVEPLIESAQSSEPPARCASILTLEAIRDRRAVEPLRALVAKETSHPYIAAFAALALGRFGDAASVPVMRAAVRTTRTMDMLKAAVPFACAKIRTTEARDVVVERVRSAGAKEPVRSAALLALGFFPDAALDASGTRPGADLLSGIQSKRRGERQAALLGFLVATAPRRDVKPVLQDVLAAETAPEVATVALLGLSHSDDADVTELLAKTAARQADDVVRTAAADLLVDRADAAVKPLLLATARNATSPRLRAACVLALGRVEDDEVQALLVEKLKDHAPVVRATAAVAFTRNPRASTRAAGLSAIDQRLHATEPNDDVRADFEKARAVLAGERADARWNEVGPDVIFADMPLTYTQRLLKAVNLRAQASLDLVKIHNLQSDVEPATMGPPQSSGESNSPSQGSDGGTSPGSSSGGSSSGRSSGGSSSDGNGGGAGSGGSSGPGASGSDGGASGQGGAMGDGASGGQSNPEAPTIGAQRTSQWQELRDLKVELIRDPYFGASDLPQPTTTPGR